MKNRKAVCPNYLLDVFAWEECQPFLCITLEPATSLKLESIASPSTVLNDSDMSKVMRIDVCPLSSDRSRLAITHATKAISCPALNSDCTGSRILS